MCCGYTGRGRRNSRLGARLGSKSALLLCLQLPAGFLGSRAKCLAVSNTYPRESLREANLIVASLEETNPVELERLMLEVV